MAKILVVDDDQDMVFMIKSVLEKNGFEVATSCDGHEALKAIKFNAPDLMIIDLTMPVMDGWRLSMKVREDARYKELPIIVLSGLVAQEGRQTEPYEPYNILIAKPFEIMELANKVNGLLNNFDKPRVC